MIGVTDFVTDLADTTAQRATKVGDALKASPFKKRYYCEFRGKAADGSADSLATGTVKIEGKISEQGGWEEIAASQSVNGATHLFTNFVGAYLELRFTPASLEASHTVDVFIRVVNE